MRVRTIQVGVVVLASPMSIQPDRRVMIIGASSDCLVSFASYPVATAPGSVTHPLTRAVRYLVHAHQASARRKADAETYDHRRAGPFLLAGEHESRRSARKIAKIFQHVVRLFHLG